MKRIFVQFHIFFIQKAFLGFMVQAKRYRFFPSLLRGVAGALVLMPPAFPAAAQFLTAYESPAPEGRTPDAPLSRSGIPANNPVSAYAPVLTAAGPAQATQKPVESGVDSGGVPREPVDLEADSLQHDEAGQQITASGNVFLKQAGRILRADRIVYDLRKDEIRASGHVVLNDINGDVHYAEDVILKDQMKNGFIEGLQSFLTDGSRFTAEKGERTGGRTTTMYDASYTPCEPCKKNPARAPAWQITSNRVIHDDQEHRIEYRDAKFEVYGVPVAYTPYFSHPDGTIKRKSGFLSPSFGYKSELGAMATGSYYWSVSPDRDLTLGLMAMTREAPLGMLEWRQRWEDAALEIGGGVTYSERIDRESGQDFKQDEELRGHIFADGIWHIDDEWRAGTHIALASDDQYMRQYDFTSEGVLENEAYVERFSGRDYAAGRLMAFQDVRVRENQEDQPGVLPEIIASYLGEPDSVPLIGGRWSAEGSFLGLQRSGDDQDMNRLSLKGGWQKRVTSAYGLVTTANASMQGDLYHTRDRAVATEGSGRSREASATRFFPQLHLQSSYPLARDFEKFQAVVEPIAALTAATNIDVNDDIPNEDSRDVQIDAGNLFEPSRFPGIDRLEDNSRVTYGLRTGLYGYGGRRGTVFLGQSYRLTEDDNPFPEGSGLDRQESDVVGQIFMLYDNLYNLDYRFQLASHDLTSQRHEVYAAANWERLSLQSGYLFAKALEGTDIEESREQWDGSAGYYFTKRWRGRTGVTYDLGEVPGLRKAYFGLDYLGQCVSWALTAERSLTDDASGDSGLEILFRLGLKNLGDFETSGFRAGRDEEDHRRQGGP